MPYKSTGFHLKYSNWKALVHPKKLDIKHIAFFVRDSNKPLKGAQHQISPNRLTVVNGEISMSIFLC